MRSLIVSTPDVSKAEEKKCPYIKVQYYKKTLCQLRLTDEDGNPIKAEAGDGIINLCSQTDKMCLLEFNFGCDTYNKWLEGAGESGS
jgi:hypothetical protein